MNVNTFTSKGKETYNLIRKINLAFIATNAAPIINNSSDREAALSFCNNPIITTTKNKYRSQNDT